MSHSDLVSGGDKSRRESPKAKRKLRPRMAALDKDHRPSSKSSIDPDDEGADEFEDIDADDDDDDYTGRPQRKRRKNPSSFQVSKQRHSRASGTRRYSGPYSISTPPSSQIHSDEEDTAGAPTAAFEEWPLQDAVLKRVTEGGQITFQLQSIWGLCASRGLHGRASESLEDQLSTRTELSVKRGTSRTAGSEAEDSTKDSNEEYAVGQIRGHRCTKSCGLFLSYNARLPIPSPHQQGRSGFQS